MDNKSMPDFQREADELYPYEPLWYNKKNQLAKRAAHIKARQMSVGEMEELRRENEKLRAQVRKLRDGLGELVKQSTTKRNMGTPRTFENYWEALQTAKQLLTDTEG